MGQRTAIYCRVSTSDQSCERQELELRAYAERAGFDVVGVWQEVRSGSKALPERQKVLELAQRREIEQILVTELTRWTRSLVDLIQTLNNLDSWNVSIIAPKGLQLDLRTPEGKLFATLLGGLAEFERDLIRERVRSGLAAAKAKGKKLGRRPGYRPSEKKAHRVMTERQNGLSYRKIADKVGLDKDTVAEIVRKYSKN